MEPLDSIAMDEGVDEAVSEDEVEEEAIVVVLRIKTRTHRANNNSKIKSNLSWDIVSLFCNFGPLQPLTLHTNL